MDLDVTKMKGEMERLKVELKGSVLLKKRNDSAKDAFNEFCLALRKAQLHLSSSS